MPYLVNKHIWSPHHIGQMLMPAFSTDESHLAQSKVKAYLSVLVKIQLQWLNIFLKSQGTHCPYEVISIYSLSLFPLAFIACPEQK